MFPAQRRRIRDARRVRGRHAGVLPLLSDSRPRPELGLSHAGTKDGYRDPRSIKLVLHCRRKRKQKRFAGAVDGLKRNGRERIDRRDVQDPAAPPRDHAGQYSPRQAKRCRELHIQQLNVGLDIRFRKAAVNTETGVVDQNFVIAARGVFDASRKVHRRRIDRPE